MIIYLLNNKKIINPIDYFLKEKYNFNEPYLLKEKNIFAFSNNFIFDKKERTFLSGNQLKKTFLGGNQLKKMLLKYNKTFNFFNNKEINGDEISSNKNNEKDVLNEKNLKKKKWRAAQFKKKLLKQLKVTKIT